MLRRWFLAREQRLPVRALGRRHSRTRSTQWQRLPTPAGRCSTAAGQSVRDGFPFRKLAQTFAAIEQVKQSRDTSVRLLATCFRDAMDQSSSSAELASALYLTSSQLAPPHEGVELRFGTRSFAPVVEQLLAVTTPNDTAADSIHTPTLDMTKFSDFGTAVQSLIASGSIMIPSLAEDESGVLTTSFVHQELLRLASEEGSGAVVRKQQRAVQLLKQCRSAEEMVFLVRMLAHQSLRIGMGEKSILAALANASASPSPQTQPEDADGESIEPPPAAAAVEPSLKPWVDSVTKAYAQQPNYTALAGLLFETRHEPDLVSKVAWLDGHAAPTVGVPVLTMSANPVSSVASVISRIRKSPGKAATCEYKYDGARVQIHLSLPSSSSDEPTQNAAVVGRIFSRNMEDNTDKYGSLLTVLQRQLRFGDESEPKELIVEGEVVAVDRATHNFLPFQVLQTKTTTDFSLFVFDLLHLDGEKLINRPLRERRELLRNQLIEDPGYLEFVKSRDFVLSDASLEDEDGEDSEALAVRGFLQEAVTTGCEGLMIKTLDGEGSEYKAGVRSYAWMKLKQDYLTQEDASGSSSTTRQKAMDGGENGVFLPDTLDLVPVGAFHGKGRRSGVFGSFLMATFDADSGKFETIGKVGTGFSDAQLAQLSERFRQQSSVVESTDGAVPDMISSTVIRSRQPDVWLSPSEVWEIKATQLTSSTAYTCASSQLATEADGAGKNGLALRFPRFVRLRTDKKPEQATESAQVAELFRQQSAAPNGDSEQ